jgi:hypothetical protein
MESKPPNTLNSAYSPSMTGRDARADVAQPEYSGAVTDNGNQSGGPGMSSSNGRVCVDGEANLRDAGGVGDR